MSENIQQDRTDIWMRPTSSDTLTTGSERLEKRIRLEHPLAVNTPKLQAIIKADPGIVALVELVQEMCSMAVSPSRDFWQSSAKIALKKWETGE